MSRILFTILTWCVALMLGTQGAYAAPSVSQIVAGSGRDMDRQLMERFHVESPIEEIGRAHV